MAAKQHHKLVTVISILNFRMKRLGFREINWFAIVHTSGDWQSRDLNPEPIIFPLPPALGTLNDPGKEKWCDPICSSHSSSQRGECYLIDIAL